MEKAKGVTRLFTSWLYAPHIQVTKTEVYWFTKGRYCCLVAKLCLTLCYLIDHSLSEFSVHGISQARILEWVAISFCRGSSQPRDQAYVSCIGRRRILYCWVTRKAQERKVDGLFWKILGFWRPQNILIEMPTGNLGLKVKSHKDSVMLKEKLKIQQHLCSIRHMKSTREIL